MVIENARIIDEEDDRCWECSGYGDDSYVDENGELQCACDTCPFNHYNDREE